VFIVVDRRDGRLDLYGPAPQSVFDEGRPSERLFVAVTESGSAEDIRLRMEREVRFDTDLWLIDIEDREGRPFVDLVAGLP
jgi:hypothetical protein